MVIMLNPTSGTCDSWGQALAADMQRSAWACVTRLPLAYCMVRRVVATIFCVRWQLLSASASKGC